MTRDELEQRLKAHDWYHDFSDDGSVAARGNSDKRQILAMLAMLPFEEAEALWNKYRPKKPWPSKEEFTYRRPERR